MIESYKMNEMISPWQPTKEQYDKFIAREIALCKLARMKDKTLKQSHTLFSQFVWNASNG
jgi:hypothetical protein